ncbi:MAG: four helix bundle protein [Flavobacteriales bacterium]
MANERVFDLQERLEDFAVMIIRTTDTLPGTPAGRLLADQLLRSGTSPALHYGEAQGAESKRDFIHKMKVALKELREAQAAIRIIQKAGLGPDAPTNARVLKECSELVAIFQTSVNTAERNQGRP